MKRLLVLTAVVIVTPMAAGCGQGLLSSWLNRGDACGAAAYGNCDACPSAGPEYYSNDMVLPPAMDTLPGLPVEVMPGP